jgi:DNA-binding transcriptional ArsR family regulator
METDEKFCNKVLHIFTLISNKIRFKVICLLREKDYCVSELVEKVGGKNSNVSQQLKILHLAGFITSRRQGKFIYYHLEDERLKQLLSFMHDLFSASEEA